MQIFNSNLKSTIQARVTAATSATPLKDLMILAKAARGLGVNTANIETLINTKLNALNGSSPLADLLVGAVASGAIPDTVGAVTTQNAVKAGDPMWVDIAGRVYGGDKYRTQLAAHKGTVTTGSLLRAFLKLDGFVTTTSYDKTRIGFSAVLTDGSVLIGDGDSNASTYGLRLRVLSADFTTVLNAEGGHLPFTDNGGSADYYASLMAVYKMPTANTFRVYYRYVRNGETTLSNIGYHDVSVNVTTKAVTIGTRQALTSTGTNSALTPMTTPRHVTDRFMIYRNEATGYALTLDLQTGTSAEIVAARSLSLVYTSFMGSGTDWCSYARPSSGNGFMVKADGTTVAAPAALNTDGSMTTTGRPVIQIAKGVFLVIGHNNTLKVVVFNTAYTSVTITTLVTDALRVSTSGSVHVVKNGLRYYVYCFGTNFSFELNGSNAVSGFRWEDRQLLAAPPCWDDYSGYFLFDIVETWHYFSGFGVSNNGAIFTGPLVEFMRFPCSSIGTAMTDATAGGVCMVALDPKVQGAPVVTYDIHRPYFSGYTRTLEKPTDPLFETASGRISGSTPNQAMVAAANTDSGLLISVGTSAVFTLNPSHGVFWGGDSASFTLQIASIFGVKAVSGGNSTDVLTFKSEFPMYGYNNKASNSSIRIMK